VVIEAWLRANCRPDDTNPINTVSSIYYDTPDWRHLREKVNGDYLKSKLRLRWYSTENVWSESKTRNPRRAYAELKRKIGSQRDKQRIEVDFDVDWLDKTVLNTAKLLALPSNLVSRGIVLPSPMVPTLLIVYRRQRYFDLRTGTRINLDSDINVRRTNPQMMLPGKRSAVSTPVLEFKGSHNSIPHGFKTLLQFGARRASFSKYLMCYRSVIGTLAT